MGARLLRYFLAHPLLDAQQIRARHAAVRGLLGLGETRLAEARSELKALPDLERLATRVFAGTASPIDLGRIAQTLQRAKWLVDNLLGEKGEHLPEELHKTVATGLKFYKSPLKILNTALLAEPRPLGTAAGVFLAGYDTELDRLNDLARSGEAQVEAYQEKLRAATGIGSLKIKNHKSYGLLIEVTRTHTAKVPSDFIRRQTMVNCDRFVTVELQELSESLVSASDKAVLREAELFRELLVELAKFRLDLRSVAQALASFDLLQSFAWQALKHGYCEPRIADDDRIELHGSRHPVVERYVGKHLYSANDVIITPQKKHLLITGPNMAGKSTIMRQVALTAILNQIGSYVPAASARLPVFDRIFTRVGASDDLARGQSTFMVEMAESANILRHATQRSLVILDEVGRGTSTRDGLAIAAAILQELALRIRCYSMFATHFHELVKVATALPAVRPMQTEVLEQNQSIVFTHRLKDGSIDNSYGLEVARLAGIPDPVLQRATGYLCALGDSPASDQPILERPLSGATKSAGKGATSSKTTPLPLERLGLGEVALSGEHQKTAMTADHPVIDRLRNLNVNRITPLQAINIISELQALSKSGPNLSLFPEELLEQT
jgi:DNA mismatch repair protein MutS